MLTNLLWLTHSLKYSADFWLSLKIHWHVLYNLDTLVWTGFNCGFTLKRKYFGFSINHQKYEIKSQYSNNKRNQGTILYFWRFQYIFKIHLFFIYNDLYCDINNHLGNRKVVRTSNAWCQYKEVILNKLQNFPGWMEFWCWGAIDTFQCCPS